jgi:hypothetical protein
VTQELYQLLHTIIHTQDLNIKIETVMRTESRNGDGSAVSDCTGGRSFHRKNEWEYCAREAELIHVREKKNPGSQKQRCESRHHTGNGAKKTLACRAPMKTEQHTESKSTDE